MPQLNCEISNSVWEALRADASERKLSIAYLVNEALADRYSVTQHTLFQVSTATALVQGIYDGAVRIGQLRDHGDFGLGTFASLDGEMVVIDGQFFQVRCDGSVRQANDDELTPFAVVTRFLSGPPVMIEKCPNLRALTLRFDSLRPSDNVLFALRVDGKFDRVHARAMCPAKEGVTLVSAAEVQPEFEFHDVEGTLVAFWSPEYARTFNVPGYHFHFISADRRCGGHLLECSGKNLQFQIQQESDFHVALPETQEFLRADLRRDPTADLARAEGQKK
jgi:acetolactate decarboxylase